MGVVGLTTTFLKNNTHSIKCISLQDKIPSDSTIVIDGYSLLYYLCQQSKLDWLNGGEYAEFSNYIHNFFEYFHKYHLIVVFDGCQEPSKIQMKIKRNSKYSLWTKILFSTKINEKIDDKDYVNHQTIFFLPILSYSVFVQTLKKMKNVSIEQSPFEADPYMAKRAYDLKAYVLSSDSDFLIYNTKGMIVMHDLEVKIVEEKKQLWGVIATQNDVAEYFKITKNHLPLLAILTGNDYINPEEVLKDFHQKLFKKYGGSKKNHVYRVGLYIRDNLLYSEKQQILEALVEVFPEKERRKHALKVHDNYLVKPVLMDHPFYDHGSIVKEDDLLIYSSKEELIENFKDLRLNSLLLDSLYFRTVSWMPLLENDEKGSHFCWKKFRERLFSLLSKNEKIIMEYYISSGSYCSHKLEIKPLNEKIGVDNAKISFQQIWNFEELKCDEEMIPLICVLKMMELLFNDCEEEFECLVISFFVKLTVPVTNVFISPRIQNYSSKFQLGMYYSNMINDLLGQPFHLESLNMYYSGVSFSTIFSKFLSKEMTIDEIIDKYNVRYQYINLKKFL